MNFGSVRVFRKAIRSALSWGVSWSPALPCLERFGSRFGVLAWVWS